MTKAEFLILADAYIKEYKRDIEIYKALKPFELYLQDEGNYLVGGVEKVLERFIDPLLEMAEYGCVTFYISNQEKKVNSLEELYDMYAGGGNEN